MRQTGVTDPVPWGHVVHGNEVRTTIETFFNESERDTAQLKPVFAALRTSK